MTEFNLSDKQRKMYSKKSSKYKTDVFTFIEVREFIKRLKEGLPIPAQYRATFSECMKFIDKLAGEDLK